ncbi:MAG: GDP-mannose 4,6-dehydratase [Mariprofundaceae bacterium]
MHSIANVSFAREWANIDICRLICQLMDELQPQERSYSSLISYVTDRPGHDWRYAIDATRMSKDLEWKPVESFETGIRKYLQWFLGHSE